MGSLPCRLASPSRSPTGEASFVYAVRGRFPVSRADPDLAPPNPHEAPQVKRWRSLTRLHIGRRKSFDELGTRQVAFSPQLSALGCLTNETLTPGRSP